MVSVVIPVYNVEKHIVNSVCSVVSQTYRDIEIILVDDGSTDNSSVKCDEYACKDNRIKVVNKFNGGLSSARNAGIDIASGDYILFLDGDDYYALDAVEYAVKIEEKTKADIVQFGYIETSDDFGKKFVDRKNDIKIEKDTKKFFEKLYEIGGEAASACTKLYKKEMFDNLRFKEGILHEDEELITRQLEKVKMIAYIPEKLYYYVMRQGSIIRSDFNLKRLDFFEVNKKRIEKLKKLGFDDILVIEYNRYFSALMNFYCTAKKRKSSVGTAQIIRLINEYYEKYDYKPKSSLKIFYKLCKINANFVYLYYALRSIFGHIE